MISKPLSLRSTCPRQIICCCCCAKKMRAATFLQSFGLMARAAHMRAPVAVVARPPLQGRAHHLSMQMRAITTSQAATDKVFNIYTDYTVYKSKGAVTVKVIKPTWSPITSGSGISVAREGTLLLEFANAIGEKTYDWDNKGTFALSAVECAEALDALERGGEKSFFHDPSKGGSDEGQVTKSLKISPARDPGTFFVNLAVNERGAGREAKYSAVLSSAEARLIRRIMDFAIPRLLGFDEIFAGQPRLGGEGGGQGPF